MKTQTHNKTTKLRKFLLMECNRNIPKFSTQAKFYFVRRGVAGKGHKHSLSSTLIKNSAIERKKFKSAQADDISVKKNFKPIAIPVLQSNRLHRNFRSKFQLWQRKCFKMQFWTLDILM